MSREFEFRFWNGERMLSTWDMTLEAFFASYESPLNEKLPLMQFTGLRDANGVEIYEGDIVKHKHADINRGIIMFNTDNFAGLPAFHVCSKDGESVGYYYGVVADDSYIVIGNIYEHPYLLEGSK